MYLYWRMNSILINSFIMEYYDNNFITQRAHTVAAYRSIDFDMTFLAVTSTSIRR